MEGWGEDEVDDPDRPGRLRLFAAIGYDPSRRTLSPRIWRIAGVDGWREELGDTTMLTLRVFGVSVRVEATVSIITSIRPGRRHESLGHPAVQ
jgi:hypothetical protein